MNRASVVGVVVGVLVVLYWRLGGDRGDPYADPALSRPPALATASEMQGRIALFDARTTAGWGVEGPHRSYEGTLELGGAEAARATLERVLAEGESVEFDYFQEGPKGAALSIKPTLLAPQPPDPNFVYDARYDLTLDGFYYKRWHHVVVRALRDGANTKLDIETHAHHGGPGRGGGSLHSMPGRGGANYRLVFEAPPGSKLYLRNVALIPPGDPPKRP